MSDETRFYDSMINRAQFPAPSSDLFARIMSGTYQAPRHLKLKASALIMSVIIAAFAAGFLQSSPFTGHSTSAPYYAGSGLYIVKYLG